MGVKKMLPPDCSADIHQIIAKAIYLRSATNGFPMLFTRDELAAAQDAEFGYDINVDGALIFRPLTQDEIDAD